jgi:hypothetical protein
MREQGKGMYQEGKKTTCKKKKSSIKGNELPRLSFCSEWSFHMRITHKPSTWKTVLFGHTISKSIKKSLLQKLPELTVER